MTKTIINFSLLFIVLVLAQAILFNRLDIFGVAVPLVFIYWIIKLPVNLNLNWTLIFSFLLGLSVDIFSDTPGMNALSCTLIAGLRLPILRLYLPREDDLTNPIPSIRTLGLAVFAKYSFTICLVYSALYYTIEAFTFFNAWRLVYSIIASTITTFIVVSALASLLNKERK